MRTVTLAELRAKLADPHAVVLNVLVPAYFRVGRIPGSVNLPMDDIRAQARERYPELDREIVTYCGSHT